MTLTTRRALVCLVAWLVLGGISAAQNLDASKIYLGSTPCVLLAGAGSPEGVVTASCGTYWDTTNKTVYEKRSGTGNTGWVVTTTASLASHLAGGLAGSVPYQTAVNTTTFLGIGTQYKVLESTGAAPQWVSSLTNVSVTGTGTWNAGAVTAAGLGVFDGASIYRNATNDAFSVYGGSSGAAGSWISIFGTTHATTPDVIAFNTAGAERVRVLANGNVGIGTTAPSVKLSVWATGSAVSLGDNTNTATSMAIAGSRAFVGYDGGNAVLQSTTGKGLTLNVNSSTFGAGAALEISAAGNTTVFGTFSVGSTITLSRVADNRLGLASGDSLESTYTSGWAGAGYTLNYNQTYASQSFLEVDRLSVRGIMNVYELLVHQIRATNGSIFVANTGKVASVVDNGGGSYTITTESEHGFAAGDLIRAQRFTGTGVYQSDMTVASVGSDTVFAAALRATYTAPAAGMEFVRLGNTTDADRQGSIYLTADDTNAPYINILAGVDAFTDWGASANTRVRIGELNGSYGYVASTFGVGMGDVAAAWLTIDPTNGVRIGHGANTKVQIEADGDATFAGAITSTSGTIGGWLIGATSLADAAGTVGLSSAVTGGDDIRFWAGHATPSSAKFRVTEAGALTSTNATINGVFYVGDSPTGDQVLLKYADPGLSIRNTADSAYMPITAGAVWSTGVIRLATNGRTNGLDGTYGGTSYHLIALDDAGKVRIDDDALGVVMDGNLELTTNGKYLKGRTTAAALKQVIGIAATDKVAIDVDALGVTTGGTLAIAGLSTHSAGLVITGGAFGTGRLYKDASLGLVQVAIAGSTSDYYLSDPSGNAIMAVATGALHVVFGGTVDATGYKAGTTAGLTRTCNPTAGNISVIGGIVTGCTAADPEPDTLSDVAALRLEVAQLRALMLSLGLKGVGQ